MPQQNFHVIRCVACSIFQVHIVKKSSNKWNCKVCSTKQSVLQVFGKGSGADCRGLVQRLNAARGVIEDEKRAAIVTKINEEILAEEFGLDTEDENVGDYEPYSNNFGENPREEFKKPANPEIPKLPANIVPKSRSKWSDFVDDDFDGGNHLY